MNVPPHAHTLWQQTSAHVRATADFVGLIALMWGFVLGTAMALYGSNDLELAGSISSHALLQKLPSLITGLVLSVRLVLFQALEAPSDHTLRTDALAALWTAWIGVAVFVACGLLGYVLGIETFGAGLADLALDELAQHTPPADVLRLLVRTSVLAAGLGWLGHLERWVLSGHQQEPSRSATRLLWLMVLWVLVIEIVDSYLAWLLSA
jgi:hypothetical protein